MSTQQERIELLRVNQKQKRAQEELKVVLESKKAQESAKQSKKDTNCIESYSGLYLKQFLHRPGRIQSQEVLDQIMDGRQFIKINQVSKAISAEAPRTKDWVTIGVLLQKSEVRKSVNNQNYLIWTLGDLEHTEFKLILFGKAYEQWWKESLGIVVGLLNPFQEREIFNVKYEGQVLKIGESCDYMPCQGFINHVRCTSYVNIRKGTICDKHIKKPTVIKQRPELSTINIRGIKAPPKFKKRSNAPRIDPKPSEFSALDRYLAGRNIEGQEFSKKVEIEIQPAKRKQISSVIKKKIG